MKKINKILFFLLGLSPSVFMLISSTYNSIVGFGFPEPAYGFTGFIASALLISAFIWPLYIVGLLLIIKAFKPTITTRKLVVTGAIIFGVFVGIIFVTVFALSMINMVNIADRVQMN